jgi:hypothetical protein
MRTAIGALLALLFLGALLYASLTANAVTCEVCIEFAGRQACRTGSASTRAEAVYGATTNACAILSDGVTDGIRSGNTQPSLERCE